MYRYRTQERKFWIFFVSKKNSFGTFTLPEDPELPYFTTCRNEIKENKYQNLILQLIPIHHYN
jgi:hypothetical protein